MVLDRIMKLSEVEEFPLIPEGIYDAVSVDIQPYVAASGNYCAWWRWKIVGSEDYAGVVLSANVNLPVEGSSKDWIRKCWKFKTFIRDLGIQTTDRTLREILKEAKGKRARIEVITDRYAGAERSIVNSIVPKEESEIPF